MWKYVLVFLNASESDNILFFSMMYERLSFPIRNSNSD